ncbi:MAG: hypothetical protein ACHQX1_00835 [Candidatus Micrarchaeales archaeon]
MAALKAIAAFVALIVIVIVVWYFVYGIPTISKPTTTTTAATTTGGTTTANQITSSSTTTSIVYATSCAFVNYLTQALNATTDIQCAWNGGPLGLWIASGGSVNEQVTITGVSDGKVYVNQISNYQCMTFYQNFTAPAQTYAINFTSGPAINATNSTQCQYSGLVLNTTLNPPRKIVYPDLYNGNFSNGFYTGWNETGTGFGPAPLNITYANDNPTSGCYIGQPWRNYKGSYVATTFQCGTQVSAGNLTSSVFYANKSFLNFKIISPQNNLLYVEILYNNTPYITVHYDTYNISLGAGASSTFRNASIPLVTVVNKPVQIRIVASTQIAENFIAAGNFALSNRPQQDRGIVQNITFNH